MGFFSSIYGGIKGLFTDEHGVVSSKRFVGIMCATMLCVTMYHNSFSNVEVAPSPVLVNAVALLAFSSLGLSSVDKYTKSKKKMDENKTEE